jgi:hypothetical protein
LLLFTSGLGEKLHAGDTRADAYQRFFAVLSPNETPIDPWPLRLDRSSMRTELSPPSEWLHTCTIITGEPNELREIHTRIPIILRKSTMMLGYPVKLEKKFWSASTAGDVRKKNRTSSIKVWSNLVTIILSIPVRRMRKIKRGSNISPIKPEIRTWYAFEGPLGDVIHNKRFFFAWKEGCLMGTYNTLEEATASLTSEKAPDTH